MFLSGFFVTYIYYPKVNNRSAKRSFKVFFKKAAKLYFWSIFLTLGYTLIAFQTSKYPMPMNEIYSGNLKGMLLDTLLLKHVYGWADILVLYIPLLLAAPIILVLFKQNLSWLVLTLSVMMWSVNFNNTSCTFACVSFFDISSWQLMFILGMTSGLYKNKFAKYYKNIKNNRRFKYLIIGLFLSSIFLSAFSNFTNNYKTLTNAMFNTETLGIGRIIVFGVWFTFFYMLIEKYQRFITKYLGWLYLKFGQNSLQTYIVQSAILFGFYYLPIPYSFWLNSVYYIFAILLTWGLLKGQDRVTACLRK